MKYFLIFFAIPIFANDWAVPTENPIVETQHTNPESIALQQVVDTWVELTDLYSAYSNYIFLAKQNANDPIHINKISDSLLHKKLGSETISFAHNHQYNIPRLDFFEYVNTKNNLAPSEIINLAHTDYAKLKNTLFLVPLLNELYQNTNQLAYGKFLYTVENKLLDIANASIKLKGDEHYYVSLQYGLLIYELSKIDFPADYSFYRRRRVFSIDSPESTRDEIARLYFNIQKLSQKLKSEKAI